MDFAEAERLGVMKISDSKHDFLAVAKVRFDLSGLLGMTEFSSSIRAYVMYSFLFVLPNLSTLP